jgi:hypothetical protein
MAARCSPFHWPQMDVVGEGWGVLATGHTAATAQMTAHAAHCAAYALKAAPNLKKERDWQYRRPLEHLRRVMFPSLAHD